MAWNRWLLRSAAVVTSALAFYFSTGFHTLWPLAWLAPLPVLLVALQEDKALPSAAVAFLAYFFGSLNLLTYLLRMAPAGAVAFFLAGPALVFALSVLVARRVARRIRHWAAVFAFPAAWTSYEFLLSSVSPHGTFGSLAYSQIDALPLIQIASITGALGITFLLLLVPSALAFGWYFRDDRRQAVPALGVPLTLLIAVLGFGWARLAQLSVAPPVRVGMAVKDGTVETFETDRPEVALPVVDVYARRVRTLAGRGAEVVVLPEKFVGVAPAYADQVYKRLASAAREGNAAVVVAVSTGMKLPENGTWTWCSGRTAGFWPSTTRPISYPALRRNTGQARDSGSFEWGSGRGAQPSARTWTSRAWDGGTAAPGSA